VNNDDDAELEGDWELDRTAFSVYKLGEEPKDYEYWLTRPPIERLAAVEFLRCLQHGEEVSFQPIQRFFEVADLE